jgi:hypothetical protein
MCLGQRLALLGFAEGLARQDKTANQRRAFWRFPPGRARQDKTAHQAGGFRSTIEYKKSFQTSSYAWVRNTMGYCLSQRIGMPNKLPDKKVIHYLNQDGIELLDLLRE